MNIVFAGTGAFGVPSLGALVEAGLAPALVISQPDRAKGRSGTATPPPLAAEATRLGLPLFQPEKLNRPEPRARIDEQRPDALVVIDGVAVVTAFSFVQPLIAADLCVTTR